MWEHGQTSNEPNNLLIANQVLEANEVSSQQSILVRLSQEKTLASLFDAVIFEAQRLTGADAGSLYLLKGEGFSAHLEFSVVRNESLDIHLNGAAGDEMNFPELPLFKDGEKNNHNVATYVALEKKPVNIEDAYTAQNFDFSGTKAFDSNFGYRSQSFLTVPLLNHEREVIGVLQLINASDFETGETIAFSSSVGDTIQAMATYAAFALDNQILLHSHKELLDAFIQSLAKITDVRSPHTSGHCQRIPVLTELIAQAACEDEKGAFKNFNLNEEEWYELRVAAWMHDCGKLATPDWVVDKSTKLNCMLDGIDEINVRFATLKEQLSNQSLERKLQDVDGKQSGRWDEIDQDLDHELGLLDEHCDFLNLVNKGGEFMSPEFKQRVVDISKLVWIDYKGEQQVMLNEAEVANLCITRGTINDDERAMINRHIEVTIDILEALPFPKNLSRVPEYAGGHHEKMDGTGYPRGLKREQLSIPARMMAVADIFEALTAKDRPYKKPMPLSVAFKILKNMRDDQHIDHEVFELFLTSGKWKKYAKEHLLEFQNDVDDVSGFL